MMKTYAVAWKGHKMHISYFQYRGEGTDWIPIDLNANILARNIYFLQIKESQLFPLIWAVN